MIIFLFFMITCIHLVAARDFYVGMFKDDDFLVAQDTVFKEALHYGRVYITYGRKFKCPITYIRVVDRLGTRQGPFSKIIRGGLHKKYVALRIRSSYNLPISVNIYVGCENKKPNRIKKLPDVKPENSPENKTDGSIKPDDSKKPEGSEDTGNKTADPEPTTTAQVEPAPETEAPAT